MRRGMKIAFAVVVLILTGCGAAVLWQEGEEEYVLGKGDLTLRTNISPEMLAIEENDGVFEITYLGDGTAQWYLCDAHASAYVETTSGYREREPDFYQRGNVLTLSEPGGYRIVLYVNLKEVGTAVADLDGTITKTYEWERTYTVNPSQTPQIYRYAMSYSYTYFDYLAYAESDAARSYSDSVDITEYIVSDESMKELEEALYDTYVKVHGNVPRGGQDYADFLLSFVQCCIAYPPEIADGVSGDVYLAGVTEYWAFPLETINWGMGDCEDTSFLAASLFLAAGYGTGVARITGHMVACVELDYFKDYIRSDSVELCYEETGNGVMYFCETTTDSPVPVGYVSPSTASELRTDAQLSTVMPDSGNEGWIIDYANGVITASEETDWVVYDLFESYYVKESGERVLYEGEIRYGESIELTPGYYRITVLGETFDVIIPGVIECTVTWTYDIGGKDYPLEVTFGIDVENAAYQKQDSILFNSGGGPDSFFNMSQLVCVTSDIIELEEQLSKLFESVGGGNAQDYADFLAGFVQEGISYPSKVDKEHGVDYGLYGSDEYWARPLETLLLKCGDCEDTAALLCALYVAAGYQAAMGGIYGHVFAGVALDSFTETSEERLKELDPYRSWKYAASVPVVGSCEGVLTKTVFYAVETIWNQVPVGYLTGGTDNFGEKTYWGISGFYPV